MERPQIIQQITDSFKVNLAVAILGPRQCGKTTTEKLGLNY